MADLPEQQARQTIDAMLASAGWPVQDYQAFDPSASLGIALREVPLKSGRCDYLLLVNRKPVGVVEAKKEGVTLSTVADQSAHYAENLPDFLAAGLGSESLPFRYESTGVETFFRDERDPHPRPRRVFHFHRPETLAQWMASAKTLRTLLAEMAFAHPLNTLGMRDCQVEGITGLEQSLAQDLPRSLIQMATGSGKTFTACAFTYRLIKFAKAKRVLFLVDRANLGRQAKTEFDQYVLPDDGRKFTAVYNVQHLTSNKLDDVCRVTICTIQRLYSMLRGEELPEDVDERSGFEIAAAMQSGSSGSTGGSGVPPLGSSDKRQDAASTLDVAYNPAIPIEAFDFIITDECHRSIYGLWRQVLEYFDAHLIGLTATPSKQTIGFFHQNLVMEYGHERAVADGVNVGYEVYRIRTRVTEAGDKVEKGFYVDRRHKETRRRRWERLDEDLAFTEKELDRSVVVPSQIRTVLTAYKDALFTELFPGRALVPKTLIFAKDDSHAEDIVHLVWEVFGKGTDFCKKITYQATKEWKQWKRRPAASSPQGSEDTASGETPLLRPHENSSGETPLLRQTRSKAEDLIQEFRTSPQLRIAVTVDMIATGTDIKPLECLLFLRDVRSRVYFEQMKGRGTRVLTPTDLQSVSGAEAKAKTHFVIVDAVGVCESDKTESRPLERKPTVAFDKLLLGVALGKRDEDSLTTLAGRLARLDRELTPAQQKEVTTTSGGHTLGQMSAALLKAFDPDEVEAASRRLLAAEEAQLTQTIAQFFDPYAPLDITRANLPHWQQDGATYFITFRLVDSLPREKLEQWAKDREEWLAAHPEPVSEEDWREYHEKFSATIERWLDQGSGSCLLELPECREIVENALKFFNGQRYQLGEFVVASNHVHVLVTLFSGHDLSDILHSWKSFTAKELIKVETASRRLQPWWDELHSRRQAAAFEQSPARFAALQFQRPVWQKESFDHIVRSPASLKKIEDYIRDHPRSSGSGVSPLGSPIDLYSEEAEQKRRDAASTALITTACAPFDKPALRDLLAKVKQESEQTIATSVLDEVIHQGFSAVAKDKAAALARSFRDYIEQHQAEIAALQILYSRPYAQRLTETMLKELEKKLREQHAAWTEDNLWNAFAATAPDKVKGRTQAGRFADLVALVRFALEQQPVLKPFADSVNERFEQWLERRSGVPPLNPPNPEAAASSSKDAIPANDPKRRDATSTSTFTPDQLAWLRLIRDHIATSLSIELDDLDYTPFNQEGGLGKAHQLFGDQLPKLLEELNEALAA
jgi:type I restriction enzyme R subunit